MGCFVLEISSYFETLVIPLLLFKLKAESIELVITKRFGSVLFMFIESKIVLKFPNFPKQL